MLWVREGRHDNMNLPVHVLQMNGLTAKDSLHWARDCKRRSVMVGCNSFTHDALGGAYLIQICTGMCPRIKCFIPGFKLSLSKLDSWKKLVKSILQIIKIGPSNNPIHQNSPFDMLWKPACENMIPIWNHCWEASNYSISLDTQIEEKPRITEASIRLLSACVIKLCRYEEASLMGNRGEYNDQDRELTTKEAKNIDSNRMKEP